MEKSLKIFICLVFCIEWSWACPISCVCKWKGGKQTVECVNKNLITIPDGIDPGTQVLDFSGNNLQTLQKQRFERLNLINLQKIYLAKCKLVKIDDRAFAGLTNLVELDLSENLLATIPTQTFSDYPSLMRLTLNDNPIKIIRNYAFHELSYLGTLEISHCEIETIEEEAFTGLSNLEWLKLNGNRLTNIRGTDSLPLTLHGIDLHHNRWVCDCRLMELHNWLLNFKIPHAIDPKCTRPPKLASRTIKSIKMEELACLPDISPTTLYLEIGEGKNVSLLCKVTATPEAQISWWFQGQLLQNDTTIAPGFHLLYYIEEGTIDKRSELFIYNTNREDNGTFICAAENSAGKSLSNYTIRVIVKEEPVVVVVPFPIEYFVAIASSASALALIILIGFIMLIIRCKRNRVPLKKKDCGKEVALQSQQEQIEQISEPLKLNGSIVERNTPDNTLLYASLADGSLMIGDVSTVSASKQYQNQSEQNPDLINDTESVGRRREDDAEDNSGHNSYQEAMDNIIDEFHIKTKAPRRVQWQDTICAGIATLPRGNETMYQHAADVHLNPGCFIDNDGYPIDYGLPKNNQVLTQNQYFYRTLPHNRNKLGGANIRYSREAEFLSRSAQPASYEHYNPSADVRYTAEGYPCPQVLPQLVCCSPDPSWVASPSSIPTVPTLRPVIQKRCNSVGAQTESNQQQPGEGSSFRNQKPANSLHVHETLTESPDEGYVGDGNETTEI